MTVKYYTVVSGDSLWAISRKFGLTLDQLCKMNGITSDTVIHPGDRLIVGNSGGTHPRPNPIPTNKTNLDAVVNWFKVREGKVTYSMENRLGPNSYDCSSAVFNALIAGGFLPQNTWPGSTETLFGLEGTLLIPITRSQARYGDIFVAGVKGHSLYGDGHTGVFLSNSTIIHCTASINGIGEKPLGGSFGNLPLHCYRLRGGDNQRPAPAPTPIPTPERGEELLTNYAENGHFTANQVINIHNTYSESSHVAAKLYAGESVYYDSVYITNKYVWISYISYSGVRRFLPIRTYTNGVRGPLKGTIV